jgi:hypothetical protein
MDHTVTVLMKGFVPQVVKRFIVSRPEGFDFQAGIGTERRETDPAGRWKMDGSGVNAGNEAFQWFARKHVINKTLSAEQRQRFT